MQLSKKSYFSVLFLVLICLGVAGSACVRAAPLRESIVGKWSNAKGGLIDFNADGTGVVPAIQDMPAYNFTYTLPDERHLKINVEGQELTVGIQIDGDTMTWRNDLNSTAFFYTRIK